MNFDTNDARERELIAEIHEIDNRIQRNLEENDGLKVLRRSKEKDLVQIYSSRGSDGSAASSNHQSPNSNPQTLDEKIQNAAFDYLVKAELCGTKQLGVVMEKKKIRIENNKPGNVIAGALQRRKDVFSYKDEIWSLTDAE